ncbi:hypothetical protein PVL29_006756 [Vitis rotundifolia]|uniref:Retrotransposon Copia-like N-terminal domain-containing protein n=1 Tax=Vitis rotundifolia TaxID=103349 RepID=A0AA39A7W5_VITRO|nr:hypothetical protein PVL29_006756 [Vitis rotundifolia]
MARGGSNDNCVMVSTAEDSGSPYFLHSGDHPGLFLVSHQLTGSNYNTWNRAMIMALTAKNKLGFVDGSLPRPPTIDLLFAVWNRCNSMVTSWILNVVSRDIADSPLCLRVRFRVEGHTNPKLHYNEIKYLTTFIE